MAIKKRAEHLLQSESVDSDRAQDMFMRSSLVYRELEPRIVFDGAIDATVSDVSGNDNSGGEDVGHASEANDPSQINDETSELIEALTEYSQDNETTREIVFIERSVDDLETLIASIDPDFEIVLLETDSDGVEQIAEVLSDRSDIDAVHIISHGNQAELLLGNAKLNLDSINGEYFDELNAIGAALGEDADILIYGCNFGEGILGQITSARLAQITGADIATSDDVTGHAGLGGDWDLEVEVGEIEAGIAIDQKGQSNWHSVLPTDISFQQGVNSYTDTQDTFVDDDEPSIVKGNEIEVEVDLNDGNEGTAQGLIRFDNIFGSGPNQIPLGSTINSAELTVQVTNSSDASAQLTLHRMLSNWTEASTWNTLTNGVQLDNVEANSVAESNIASPDAMGAQVFSGLAGTLQAWSNGDTNYGWVIVLNDADGWDFSSSEETVVASRPILSVNFTPPSSTPPTAQNDSAITNVDTPVNIDLVANDTDPDSTPIYVLDVTNPANGSVVNNNDGTVTYTPGSGYTGSDSFNYIAADLENTTSYWRLDGNGVDIVSANNGTITGTTTVAGIHGNALSFDEVDDRVVVPDFSFTDEFSLSFKIKVDDNSGADFQYLYSHGDYNNTNSLNIFLAESSHATIPNILRTMIRDTNDTLSVGTLDINVAGIIGDGQWHTYTLTASAASGTKVYLDGVEQAADATRGGDAFDPTTDIYFGAPEDLAASEFYGGSLDSVQVFNRALDATEAAATHTGGTSLGTVNLTVSADNGLLLATKGDVSSPSGAPRLDSWSGGEVLSVGDPNLDLQEPGTTDGTFKSVLNLDNFASDVGIEAIHYVSRDITVGGANSVNLLAGDVLLVSKDSETLISTNTLSVTDNDVFVFRPDTPGDYSSGTFIFLLEDPVGANIQGMTLIEQDTLVGDYTLQAGDFLFSHSGASEHNQIKLFQTTDTGSGTTSGTVSILLDGSDSNLGGFNDHILGIDLIESTQVLGGVTFNSGDIVLVTEANNVGSNSLAVTEHDIIKLDVSATTLVAGSGNGAAVATKVFEGADVGLNSNDEELAGISFGTAVENSPPVGLPTITGTVTEDQTLTADTSGISDADGLGTFSYQWLADGVAIVGATNSTHVLGDADVGKLISVEVTYTDGNGNSEGPLTSAQTVAVANVNDNPVGIPTITGTATEDQILTADTSGISDADGLGAFSYQWLRNGVAIVGATASNYTLVDADVGTQISVRVSYTDGQGTPETVTSSQTAAVSNVNDNPVGLPVITGTVTEDQTLTADTSGISDADGLGAFSYQWLRNGVDITGATASNYTLGDADVGTQISVRVSYTDGQGTPETVTSLQTAAVGNVNDAPSISIDGTTLSYAAGFGWLAIDQNLVVSDIDSPTLTSATISIASGFIPAEDRIRFTNQLGITGSYNAASGVMSLTGVASVADYQTALRTISYENVNITPTQGILSVSFVVNDGTDSSTIDTRVIDVVYDAPPVAGHDIATVDEGSSVTINVSANDVDDDALLDLTSIVIVSPAANGSVVVNGDGTVTYTHNGSETTADSFTYTIEDAANNVSNTATVSVTINPVNDNPVGLPVITGTVTEDQTLTADTSGISDADGLGAFTYQWLRDGVAIVGATSSTFTLGDVDVGTQISVEVSYTDAQGTAEGPLTSAQTAAVANVNDSPVGLPVITGTATEDQILTADTSGISDPDGFGAFSYQWLRDGVAIVGATSSTYTLGDLDVGTQISVEVSYTDTHGTAEGPLTSAQTAAVANVNDAPTGLPTITGTVIEDQTLTVDTSAIADADGLGPFSYQWLRDGVAIAGATSTTHTLDDVDVGTQISVQVSYTDGYGAPESVTSLQTVAVGNVNDTPVGIPVITGTVTEDQVLTADTSGISDVDGLGAFNYQWLRNGVAIVGANASTYTLGDADVGALISVEVTYTDGHGTAEGPLVSAQTAAVVNVNDNPVGIPVITGTVTEDQTLTADTSGISDDDGLGPFSYQWFRDGVAIIGANASTYTLGDADVGAQMSVAVSYTDNNGTPEGPLTSAQTTPVVNINDDPVITSDGGLATANVNMDENNTLVTTVVSSDVDGGAPAFSIVGGAEAALFSIDPVTGVLSFNVAPDFEFPADGGGINQYDVIVQVNDGNGGLDTQAIRVIVLDVDENTSPAPVTTELPDSDDEEALENLDDTDTELDINPFLATSGVDILISGNATSTDKPSKADEKQPPEPELLIAPEPEDEPPQKIEIKPVDLAKSENPVELKKIDHKLLISFDDAQDEIKKHQSTFGLDTKVITFGTSTLLTAGYVSWVLRSGALLSALLSTLPAWSSFDPIVIMTSRRSKEDKKALDEGKFAKVERVFEKTAQMQKDVVTQKS